jgi:CDP-glycerol glycerophosphotransferase (TagB/SpsB family)
MGGVLSKNVRVVRKASAIGFWMFLRSRYVFHSHSTFWFARSTFHQVVVNLWHGMPIKEIGDMEANSGIRVRSKIYSIATSEFFADIIAKAFILYRERVLVTGLPRNEWLFESDERHRALREGRSRMLVWFPTFRSAVIGSSVRHDAASNIDDPITVPYLHRLDGALDGRAVIVIVKLHPLDTKNTITWPEFRNLRVINNQVMSERGLNNYRVLAEADALVTDYSSVAIDFLLLKRPIGFYMPDEPFYTRGFIPAVRERLAEVGMQIRSYEELVSFLVFAGDPGCATRNTEEFYRTDLRAPSADILRTIGLSELAPPPVMEETRS